MPKRYGARVVRLDNPSSSPKILVQQTSREDQGPGSANRYTLDHLPGKADPICRFVDWENNEALGHAIRAALQGKLTCTD